ncbi:homoserine kinase [Hymenobacter sp. BT683]|uniref:Homoserine kinase n=1 Tax=Hymenobacter jeongseonensis TaxID=2791027 RepID=A0ABS0ICS6_9BACT|nr:homoserine kinase [Hymenobacter jeongseonensis]MBF9236152.1 homoserine kinase [Hymenobacter jeongseonensis]
MPNSVLVHSPATLSNLGCGFDVFGLALAAPYDTIRICRTAEPGVRIQHLDQYRLPTDPAQNVAGVALLALLAEVPEQIGFDVEIIKGIKPGSGVGSSAASAAGAVVGANALLGHRFTKMQLVDFAMAGELVASGARHADNIAPAIFGGFTVVRALEPVLDILALPAPPLWVAVVHPQIEVKTSDSRKVLPATVPLGLAVRQWANVAGLVAGFLTADYDLIGRSMEDYIVEPARLPLIPGLAEARKGALAAGAIGGGISGSGPSVFMLNRTEASAQAVGEAMGSVFAELGIAFNTYVGPVATEGAKVISEA